MVKKENKRRLVTFTDEEASKLQYLAEQWHLQPSVIIRMLITEAVKMEQSG